MRLCPMIAALTVVGAASFAALPALAQNVRDSAASAPETAQSQMAPVHSGETKTTTMGSVTVAKIPVTDSKASAVSATPPATGTTAK